MPVYLQIILLFIGVVIFFFLLMLIAGWGIRRYCFQIIAEMEEQRAFNAGSAVNLPDKRGNFFKMGAGNYRPKALNVLLADKVVIKTGGGKYYLNKDKLANVKAQAGKQKQ
jgi:hypothetical protein